MADKYCEHNREKDSYGNSNCPYCEVEFLHKALADCDRRRRNWKKKVKSLQSQLESEKEKRAKVEVQNLKLREGLERALTFMCNTPGCDCDLNDKIDELLNPSTNPDKRRDK